MANNVHEIQVIGPRDTDPVEVFCSWAEDQGASNVLGTTHHCPFCGQVPTSEEMYRAHDARRSLAADQAAWAAQDR